MAADASTENDVPDQRDRESRKQDQALDSLTDMVRVHDGRLRCLHGLCAGRGGGGRCRQGAKGNGQAAGGAESQPRGAAATVRSCCCSASPVARFASPRERALAAVVVLPEDVATIALEFELDKKVAERRLREHDGDLVATLSTLMQT